MKQFVNDHLNANFKAAVLGNSTTLIHYCFYLVNLCTNDCSHRTLSYGNGFLLPLIGGSGGAGGTSGGSAGSANKTH